MRAMTWVALAVVGSMGALALAVLLQVLMTILVWAWRGRRPGLALGASLLRAVAERFAPVPASPPAGPIATADWLAGAGWGAGVYGLAGPLAMMAAASPAPPGRIDLGVVGFVLGVLGVALVSPACRPLVRRNGIRATLTAGTVAGASLASGALSGLAAWVETLGPAVWLWWLTTCVAGGAGLGAGLGASGVIAPMRLLGDWAPGSAPPPAGRRGRMQSAITLSAVSLWLGSSAMVSSMMLAASLLWIHSLLSRAP